jgi:hypothetical protein
MISNAATDNCAPFVTKHPVKTSGTATRHPKYVICALSGTALAVHYTIFQATHGCQGWAVEWC